MINPSTQSGVPASQGKANRGGIPYLKTENVNFDKRTAKILATKLGQDQKGSATVILKIAYAGNTYLWTLRMSNPNLVILCERFGNDEEKWVGESFMLALETDEFTNISWPRVSFASEKKSGK